MNSKVYSHFAKIYDQVMKKVPYKRWSLLLMEIFKEFYFTRENFFLEIAAGTGSLLKFFEDSYPNLVGLDISLNMLKEARNKVNASLLQANMAYLPFLDQSFDCIYCTHDSINYLQKKEDLSTHLEEVRRVLITGGVYIFDAATRKNVIENYHKKSFREKHNGIKMKWDNFFDAQKNQIISTLNFKENHGIKKIPKKRIIVQETHVQTIYSEEEIKELLDLFSFRIIKKYADYQENKPLKYADIMVYVVQVQ